MELAEQEDQLSQDDRGDRDKGADFPEPRPDTPRGRQSHTAAEALGIPPAVGRGKAGDGAKELRHQLEAAEQVLEEARAEAREARDNHLRTAAELENMRRRHRQEQVERLPVVDNFHRALEHAPEADQQLVSGIEMILRQFEEVLASEGVEAIEAVGRPFDPNVHQAVSAEPSEEHPDDVVIAELQRGYRLHDRVLRPSLVKVSRNL